MPEALAITHDGRNLYAGGANSEAGLIVLVRDTATGALAPGGCLRGDKDHIAASDDWTSYDEPGKG